MGRTRVKICGVRDATIARAAAGAGADAIGLVFVAASPRFVTVEQAEQVVAALPAFVEPIGLFADHDAHAILETCRQLNLRTVQLHGDEPPEMARELRGLRIIKALSFGAATADRLNAWLAVANLAAILWDSPRDGGSSLTGGSGRAFPWAQLAGDRQHPDLPIILAGGLTPANVADAVATVHPWAVDVSSGVESSHGVKDPTLIAQFCDQVRRADCESQTPDPRP